MSEPEDTRRLAELYQQALQRNEDAKARLQKLNEYGQELSIRVARQTSSSKEQLLNSHLDNIRLQQQHNKLQTLSHYAAKIDAIAREDGIHESLPTILPSRQGQQHRDVSLSRAQNEVDELLKHAKSLTTDIELALVKARNNLKREEKLLREIQSETEHQPRGETQVDKAIKLRALEVTRDEIQRWIEETLAQCEQSDGNEMNGVHHDKNVSDDHQSQIDAAYEDYLQKRKHLMDIMKLLEQPMIDTNAQKERPTPRSTPSAERQSRLLQPAAQLRQYRRSSSHLGETSSASLAEIQNTSLSRYRHEKLLSSFLSQLTEQTQLQDTMLLQSLGRLSHESHLLPSHPYTTSRIESINQGLTRQQMEANQFLRAWIHASSAAAQIRDQNTENQATDAKISLQQAEVDAEELAAIEDMRSEVLRTEDRAT